MKIRFITTINAGRQTFRAGEIHDLENEQANHYVQSGIATKTPEPSSGTKPGEVTRGAIRAPDPASQASADVYEGVEPQPLPTGLSSGNPPSSKTTAIPGADVNPAYIANEPLPSATDSNVKVIDPSRPSEAEVRKTDDAKRGGKK